jgi:hypothetical protein
MSLPNHSKDLINGFINRKSAIENTKLTLEALWNVIAPTTCKGVKTSLQMHVFCCKQGLRNILIGDIYVILPIKWRVRGRMYKTKHHLTYANSIFMHSSIFIMSLVKIKDV